MTDANHALAMTLLHQGGYAYACSSVERGIRRVHLWQVDDALHAHAVFRNKGFRVSNFATANYMIHFAVERLEP